MPNFNISVSEHFVFLAVDYRVYLIGNFIGGELDVIAESITGIDPSDM